MVSIILYLNIGIFIYFCALASWYALTLVTSFPDVFDSFKEAQYGNLYKILEKGKYLPVSVIMPAYNEAHRILNAAYSVLQSDYQNVQLIIVNDGSTDNTLDLLIKEFECYEIPPIIKQTIKTAPVRHLYKSHKFKNLTVIDKEHGQSPNAADANNCGLNALVTPIFLTVDADTILEPEAITRILFRLLFKKGCITVGGVIYVLNGNKVEHGRMITSSIPNQLVPAFQSTEYVRAFTYGRSGLNAFSGALCNPGAFTLNETSIVKEVNGFEVDNFAYDAEMTMKLHNLTRVKNYPTRIYFISSAIAWSEVPGTLKKFWSQRDKWQRGMLKSACNYKNMFFNPFHGYTGMVVFPAYILFDIMAPVIEFTSYILLVLAIILNLFSLNNVFWFIFLAWGYLVMMTIASYFINLTTFAKFNKAILFRVIGLVTLEMFGFRQFRSACCFFGTFHYLFNRIIGKPL